MLSRYCQDGENKGKPGPCPAGGQGNGITAEHIATHKNLTQAGLENVIDLRVKAIAKKTGRPAGDVRAELDAAIKDNGPGKTAPEQPKEEEKAFDTTPLPTAGKEFGQGGKGNPIADLKDRNEQTKAFARIMGDAGNTYDDDPVGLKKAGPPAGLDMTAFKDDTIDVVRRNYQKKTVAPSINDVYAAVGKRYGLSKRDFQRALVALGDDVHLRGSNLGMAYFDQGRGGDPELAIPTRHGPVFHVGLPPAAHAEQFAEAHRFSDAPTDFSSFDDGPTHPLSPMAAWDYFHSLVPVLGVKDPGRWADGHRRAAFTLAETADEALLTRVHSFLEDVLGTGKAIGAAGRLDEILDAAGVTPKSSGYAETVFRTNMMDSYNEGATKELQDPDVADYFPAWKYLGIRDGRQRPEHEAHFDHYFANSVPFAQVRDSILGKFTGYNCRCNFQAIDRHEWTELQAKGASFSAFAERFCDQGENKGKPGPCPGPEKADTPHKPPPLPATPEALHTAADRKAGSVIGKFKSALAKVTSVPVLKQVKQLGNICKSLTAKLYKGLESRYGRATAVACMASGQVSSWGVFGIGAAIGVPLWIPGGSLLGSLPAVAMAEAYHQLRGKHAEDGGVDMAVVAREGPRLIRALRKGFVAAVRARRAGPERFCQDGPNKGKPGPCPEDSGHPSTPPSSAGSNPEAVKAKLRPDLHPLAHKATLQVAQTLRNTKGLTSEQRVHYFNAAQDAFANMSPKSLERFHANNHKETVFYGSLDALSDGVHAWQGPAKTQEQADARASARGKIGGCFAVSSKKGEAKKGGLHLDGDYSPELQAIQTKSGGSKTAHETYAHEFAHVVDGPDFEYSHGPEWTAAWKAEMVDGPVRISAYSQSASHEGWAEFGRAVVTKPANHPALKKHFPRCFAVWEQLGLVKAPAQHAEPAGTSGDQVMAELFSRRIQLGDDPASHGDILLAADHDAHAETALVPAVVQQKAWSCGPAAMKAVAARFGLHVRESDLRRLLGADPDNGTPPSAMLVGARRLGLVVEGHEGWSVPQLERALIRGFPVIACVQMHGTPKDMDMLEAGHWCVFTGRQRGVVECMDPATGQTVEIAKDDLPRVWADRDTDGRKYVRFGIVVKGRRDGR